MPERATTIVAPATAAGEGAIAILRLSGPRALPIGSSMTGKELAGLSPRTLTRCELFDDTGGRFDAGLVAVFRAPNSYTGEDLVEIHLHGSPVLLEIAAKTALSLGAVPAQPGEFSRRAFLNGKIDLTQAEGLADLIAARSDAAARAAFRQLRGAIGEALSPLRDRMLSLLATLEAAIDFPEEEDIPPAETAKIMAMIEEMEHFLRGLSDSFRQGRLLREGAVVAIAGVANVGKSSLLNRLLGEERAIVTEIPGTTRDYLSGEISLSGVPVRLVDTAGLRDASDPVEREGVRRSRRIVAESDLVLFLLDGSRPAYPGDEDAYREVAARPHLVLVNKNDLPAAESGERFSGAGFRGRISLSARTGKGIPDLLRRMAKEIVPGGGDILGEAVLSRLRQVEAVSRAREALARGREAARSGLPEECIAADLRDARQALAELTGEIAPEEVLDRIFSSFCIGK
ncbi:MAG: tRNA uridine-5-carboxymethylaminomethyl(34) synthesis GTPase MnmE [Deltaproteobacteria bacterium]